MKKYAIPVGFLILGLATSCESQTDTYKECLDKYERKAVHNGGNGGMVDPKTFCQDMSSHQSGKEYIVVFKEEVNPDAVLKTGGMIKKTHVEMKAVVAILTSKQLKTLQKESMVDYIEPNHKVTAF